MRKSIAFVTAFEKLGQRRIDSIIESSLCIESLMSQFRKSKMVGASSRAADYLRMDSDLAGRIALVTGASGGIDSLGRLS
jgi:hypothetical protein